MADITLQQAQNILDSFPTDDKHNTIQHSIDVLYIGQQIAGPHITQALECALLLHDIGHFLEDDTNNPIGHGRLASKFLEEHGISAPEILLPVACHEDNEYLEEACYKELLFQKQGQDLKREILWNCRIVCEADIISHMRDILKESHVDDECYNNMHFLNLLESGMLPTPDAVVHPYDKIMYILCGLSLIQTQESIIYLKKEALVQQLLSRLPVKYRSRISEIVYLKYGL